MSSHPYPRRPPSETCIHFCTFAQAVGRFAHLHPGQHVVLSLPPEPIRLAPSEIGGLMVGYPMRSSSLLALLASLVFVTAAEDGAQVYNTLCVACHGPDGKGLNGLPPLVGSDWPKGPA
ncbi:MAG: c-type cytochrome, partial [Verrucomicrobiota bacterium]